MRRAFSFLLAAAMAPASADPVALDLAIGGRVVKQTMRYTYQWPGVYFEAAFSGDSVDVKVDDGENNLYVWIDGVHKLTLTRPGRATVAFKDLGPGAHVVRLEKASETQTSIGHFEGFYVSDANKALPPPAYARAIEFIGDSYTVGYGDLNHGVACTTDDVRETTDTSRAWAPAVARRFGAAYRINAFSGRGVVRNYNGIAPGDTLPYLYDYALFDHSVPAADAGWKPDVVIVGLGTNDFSTPLNPGEKWANRDALHADYVRTYADFVKSLRARYPAAHILMMAPDNMKGETARQMQAAAELAKAEGVGDLDILVYSGLDWQGCHAHPSLADEAMLTALVTDQIARLPKFAPTP